MTYWFACNSATSLASSRSNKKSGENGSVASGSEYGLSCRSTSSISGSGCGSRCSCSSPRGIPSGIPGGMNGAGFGVQVSSLTISGRGRGAFPEPSSSSSARARADSASSSSPPRLRASSEGTAERRFGFGGFGLKSLSTGNAKVDFPMARASRATGARASDRSIDSGAAVAHQS
eukprot:31116-Pelagococcus_subviridis.AAC.3